MVMKETEARTEAEGVTLTLIADKTTRNGVPEDGPPAEEEDYDPHLHRQVDNATTNFETLVHLLKCSLGTGILAMPQAFAKAGLVTGIIGTVVVGILVTYCLHVLVKAQYKLCKKKRVALLTYPESMRYALSIGPRMLRPLANISAPIVDVFLVVYQLGICCVYIVFIASNIKKIVDPVYEMSVEIHMLIALGPLILFNLIRDLKRLAPFSSLANLLTFVGLAVVVYYLLSEKALDEPMDLWGSAKEFPLFFGTTLFALTAVGVVIALENNMKTPKSFGGTCGVLNIGMSFIVLLYVAVGSIGYVFCFSKCADTITLNLPDTWLASSVLGLFAVAIFISYVLQCYVPVDIVWRTYMRPHLVKRGFERLLLAEYGLRIALCLLTFVLAVAVPRLGLFISLFGALCLSALGICFPAVLEVCAAWGPAGMASKFTLSKDVLLFFVGLIGLVVGTYTALLAIVTSFVK